MSFVNTKKTSSFNDGKYKDRLDENLKTTITDKIWELTAKNNSLKERVRI